MAPTLSEQLLDALAASAGQSSSILSELLDGITDERQMFATLAKQGIVDEESSYRIWAEQLGLPFHNLDDRALDPAMLHRLPLDLARRYGVVAVDEQDGVLSVALRDPFDIMAVDAIQEVTKLPVQAVVTTPSAIDRALARQRRGQTGIEGLITRIQKAETDTALLDSPERLKQVVGDDAVVQIVDYLIDGGLRLGCSDIHIEPQRSGLRIRVRVDGKLEVLHRFPGGLLRPVVSRLKVMAGMDIGESRKPQDGRFMVDEHTEVRASSLPSSFGEKMVLRILDRSGNTLAPDSLDMSEANLAAFQQGYSAPNGLVLLTGPTGSGKTTTLYTALADLNDEERNIVTVEDPVEYELPGTTQVQVDTKANRTFANALRAILRQDPDIVMVGEIRDPETAGIAVQAALTGHLVLSTLHTNSAPAAVHRLVDMDIPPYLLGPSLRCVVAQRLVPRLCSSCAQPTTADPRLLGPFGLTQAPAGLKAASGCKACRMRGYSGRIALHEVLSVAGEVSRLISRNADEAELMAAIRATRYQPMLLDGMAKAIRGLCALEEVLATCAAG